MLILNSNGTSSDSVSFKISLASSKPTLPLDSDDENPLVSNLRSALDTSLTPP